MSAQALAVADGLVLSPTRGARNQDTLNGDCKQPNCGEPGHGLTDCTDSVYPLTDNFPARNVHIPSDFPPPAPCPLPPLPSHQVVASQRHRLTRQTHKATASAPQVDSLTARLSAFSCSHMWPSPLNSLPLPHCLLPSLPSHQVGASQRVTRQTPATPQVSVHGCALFPGHICGLPR